MQLRKEAWKKIQDFNGVWTRDLAIPGTKYVEINPPSSQNTKAVRSLHSCHLGLGSYVSGRGRAL